jgi:hypothetical protein
VPSQYKFYNNFAFNQKGNMPAFVNLRAVCATAFLIILFHGDLVVNLGKIKIANFQLQAFCRGPCSSDCVFNCA